MDSDTILARDIMSQEVVSVSSEMPLFEAAKIIAEHGFDGVPVVDKKGKLVGILTEYDLISKGSAVHLPTFQFLLQNVKVFRQDRLQFGKDVQGMLSLKVEDIMNREPLTLAEDATLEETVKAFCDHHRVNPIPIIDKDDKVVGVVSRFDILKPMRNIT